jgi:biotin operon repressor
MNIQDVVKALTEKGFNISEQEVRSKIDTFSKTFRLPAEEAGRAALNHFISTNKLSAPAGQNQTPVAALTPTLTAAAHQLHDAPGISDRVFKLIVEMSRRVPYRLASCPEIVKEAATMGISQKQVEEAVNALITEGNCIEPFFGKIYPISQRKIGLRRTFDSFFDPGNPHF